MTDEIFGIMNDADEVMESVGYDPFGMNVLVESELVINETSLKDPAVVMKLKKQLKSAKSWDKVLKILSTLNMWLSALVAGVGVGTSITTACTKMDAYAHAKHAPSIHEYSTMKDMSTNAHNRGLKIATTALIINLIQLAITVLIPLVNKAIDSNEVNTISKIKGPVENSIKLYETQLKNVKSEEDKKKLQDSIDRLKELQTVINDESNRVVTNTYNY